MQTALYGAPPVDFLPYQDPRAYEQLIRSAEEFIATRALAHMGHLSPQPVVHIVKYEVGSWDSCWWHRGIHGVSVPVAVPCGQQWWQGFQAPLTDLQQCLFMAPLAACSALGSCLSTAGLHLHPPALCTG